MKKLLNMSLTTIPGLNIHAYISPDAEALGDALLQNTLCSAKVLVNGKGVTVDHETGEPVENQIMFVIETGQLFLLEVDNEQDQIALRYNLIIDPQSGLVAHSGETIIPIPDNSDHGEVPFRDWEYLHEFVRHYTATSGMRMLMLIPLVQ